MVPSVPSRSRRRHSAFVSSWPLGPGLPHGRAPYPEQVRDEQLAVSLPESESRCWLLPWPNSPCFHAGVRRAVHHAVRSLINSRPKICRAPSAMLRRPFPG